MTRCHRHTNFPPFVSVVYTIPILFGTNIEIDISFKIFAVDTTADQAIVIDFDTSEVLFEKNADQVVPPASMTKIMTTYAAFDRLKNTGLSINGLCKISPKAYKMGGSRTFLELDDSVSIEDLLIEIVLVLGSL